MQDFQYGDMAVNESLRVTRSFWSKITYTAQSITCKLKQIRAEPIFLTTVWISQNELLAENKGPISLNFLRINYHENQLAMSIINQTRDLLPWQCMLLMDIQFCLRQGLFTSISPNTPTLFTNPCTVHLQPLQPKWRVF